MSLLVKELAMFGGCPRSSGSYEGIEFGVDLNDCPVSISSLGMRICNKVFLWSMYDAVLEEVHLRQGGLDIIMNRGRFVNLKLNKMHGFAYISILHNTANGKVYVDIKVDMDPPSE